MFEAYFYSHSFRKSKNYESWPAVKAMIVLGDKYQAMDFFNEGVELNGRMAKELERLGRVVGKEGKLTQRASLGDVRGCWREAVDSVNDLIDDLVHPTIETARVIGAVAQFERDLIRERQREGIALAKQRNVYLGRVRSLSAAQADDLLRRIRAGERNVP